MNETEILSAALKLECENARAAFLEEACKKDSQLLGRIESILDLENSLRKNPVHFPTNSNGAFKIAEAGDSQNGRDTVQGSTIGPYELREVIGEGGMGSVWRAQQLTPVRRLVALKVIKLGMDTREVIARFESERQALAIMNHPNIAKVLNAGATDSGRPYFVMELVNGVSITEYCDDRQLGMRERLELFLVVCDAVQHAHLKGVIHRDIKSSNVLVSDLDSKPIVKVIDFGIAKATDQKLTEKTLFTAIGQFVGTPNCMSPEQADMSCHDIDTRTDVYSLGVLLYELLTGSTPFEFDSRNDLNHAEIVRIIREDEPPRMSRRLSALEKDTANRPSAKSFRTRRRPEDLRGDLDIIAEKALEKDRERRYQTPLELARDIQHFLRGETINARPASAVYRLKKTINRNKTATVLLSIIVILLLTGIVVSASLAIRAMRAESASAERLIVANRLSAEAIAKAKVERWERYLSNMSVVGNALGVEFDLGLAKRSLNSAPKEHRGWEWGYYSRQLDSAINVLELGGSDFTYCPVFDVNPLNWQLAIHQPDGSLATWSPGSGVPFQQLENPTVAASRLVYSPDGKRVAIAADDFTIRVWEVETAKPICKLTGHLAPVLELAFNGDGSLLGSGGSGQLIKVWNVETGESIHETRNEGQCNGLVFTGDPANLLICAGDKVDCVCIDENRVLYSLEGHTASISKIAISRDQKLVATSGSDPDNSIRVWDSRTGKHIGTMSGHTNHITAIKFARQGTRIASASLDRTLRTWDVNTGKPIAVLEGHTAQIFSLDVCPDGSRIVSGSLDATVRLWDGETGETLAVMLGHRTQIGQVAFSHDANQIASASFDGTIRIWNARPEEPTFLRGHERFVYDIDFRPDGRQLASVGWDGTLRVWDMVTGQQLQKMTHVADSVSSVAYDASGQRLVTTSRPSNENRLDNQLTIWDSSTGDEMLSIHLPGNSWIESRAEFSPAITQPTIEGSPNSIEPTQHPDSRLIAVGRDDGKVQLFDAINGSELAALIGHQGCVMDVAFSPDGSSLASGARDNTVRIWNLKTHQPSFVIAGFKAEVSKVVYNVDGSMLAAASNDQTVRLWDCEKNEIIASLLHGSYVYGLAFAPDGTRLAVGCADNSIRLWDLEKFQEVAQLRGHQDYVHAISFSPDGKQLVSASGDGTIRIWKSSTLKE